MPENNKTILITGASGFLGGELCRFFTQKNWQVRAMVRNPQKHFSLSSHATGGIFTCDLPEKIDEKAFMDQPKAIIHCAYASQETDPRRAEAVNLQGTERLKDLAQKQGVGRFIFLSSLAAIPDAASYYGRSKWEIEQSLDSKQDLILRPGLVVGAGGLFDRIRKSIARLPIVPLFFGGKQQLHILWIGDLCQAVQNALEKGLTGVYRLGFPEPVLIRDFYQSLAKFEGKVCHFLPLPGAPALWALQTLEKLGLHLPITSENLLGLKLMKAFDMRKDLYALGLETLSLENSLKKLAEDNS